MNNQEGVVKTTMQTEQGEVDFLDLLGKSLKEKIEALTCRLLPESVSVAELVEAQKELVDLWIASDARQLLALQSMHHFGNSQAAIREVVDIHKNFKHVTDQKGVFDAAVALADRAVEVGVVIKLSMPTAKEEGRHGTKSFLTVSKFHSEVKDTVMMHPTPTATAAIHGG